MGNTTMVRITEHTCPITLFASGMFSGVSCDQETERFVGMVSVRAEELPDSAPEPTERPQACIVAVVDKSGSMSDKMNALKNTLNFIIGELGKNDQLGIVEYDTGVYTTLPMTKMDNMGKQKAMLVVNKLSPGSATNLSGGLMEGLRMVPTGPEADSVVSSVLLLTDGKANSGIRTTNGIISMMRDAQSQGIGKSVVHTFGFGTGHNAKMLKDISDAAEGTYYYIQGNDTIATAFADCLAGLLSVVGQGIELKIDSVNQHDIEHIWTHRQKIELQPKRSYRIMMGDLQEGEERDVPLEIHLPVVSPTDSMPIIHATLSYFDVKAETMREIQCDLEIARPSPGDLSEAHKQPNLLVDRNLNRCKGGKVMEEAAKLAENNQLPAGRAAIEKVISEIQASPSAGDEFCVTLLKEMQESLSSMKDKTSYAKKGQFQVNKFSKAINSQRCTDAKYSDDGPMMFETKAKRCMKRKARK